VTKILVTGANGLLGQKLSRIFSQKKEVKLTVTARQSLHYSLPESEFIKMEISNQKEVNKVIAEVSPEVVINTAAMTKVDDCETNREQCWLCNTTAVEFLVRACEKINSHFIQLSTDFVFDGTNGPNTESDIPNPLSFYGKSKLASEQILQNSSLPWSIVRTVLVYGVSQPIPRSNIVLWVIENLRNKNIIEVIDDNWRTPTLAEDLATGCELIAMRKVSGVYHISGEEIMTPYEIAIKTAGYFGLNKDYIHRTDSVKFKQKAPRPRKTGFIIEKAKRDLGYQPRSFNEGLELVKKQLSKVF